MSEHILDFSIDFPKRSLWVSEENLNFAKWPSTRENPPTFRRTLLDRDIRDAIKFFCEFKYFASERIFISMHVGTFRTIAVRKWKQERSGEEGSFSVAAIHTVVANDKGFVDQVSVREFEGRICKIGDGFSEI
jgi:hypothetical protein